MAVSSIITAAVQIKANVNELFSGLSTAMTYFELLNAVRGAGRKILCGSMPLNDQRKGRDGKRYPFFWLK